MSIKNNRSEPPFVLVKIEMLRDKKYQRLSITAKMLWIYLRGQYNPYKPNINPATGEIQVNLSYKQMAKGKGFSPKAMSRAIKELISSGFIKKTEQGGMLKGMSAYSFTGKYAPFPKQDKSKTKRG